MIKKAIACLNVAATSTAFLLGNTAFSGLAHADSASIGLEEIVVTARKREESLQDTPIAVSALTAQDLEKRNIGNALDIANYVPNVVAGPGTVSNDDANFFIRGIGQQDAFSNVEPGVGVYIDGVYLGRTAGAAVDLAEIERVEVLRGPQGTLFGRNTIGGAISIVTKRPENDFGGKASLKVGERDRLDASLSVNVPIVTDQLLSRFSVITKNQDGYVKSSIPGERNSEEDVLAGRADFRWLPNDMATIDLSVDATRRRGTVPCNRNIGVDTGLPWIPDDAANDISSDQFQCFTSQPSIDQKLDIWGANLTQAWDLDGITFKSITAYRELKQYLPTDQDGTTYDLFDLTIHKKQDQFSQEFQLSGKSFNDRFDWLVGAYYFHEHIREQQQLTFAIYQFVFGQYSVRTRDFSPNTNSYALFGQGTYHITGKLSTTMGIRYNYEKKSIDILNKNIIGGNAITAVDTEAKDNFTSVTPRVGLEFKATDDVLLYVLYSEGFRSGGFNARAGNNSQVLSFDPENAMVYEGGVKSEFFDHRVRLNLAGYYTDYKDIQILAFSEGFVSNRNAGDARLYGFEGELLAEVTPQLMVNAALGYTNSKYTKLGPAAGSLTLDSPLPYAPEWTAILGAQYTAEIGKYGTILARVDYTFVDKQNFGISPGFEPSYSLVNFRVEWEPKENLAFAVYGLNTFNEKYATYRQDDRGTATGAGIANEFVAPPRELGAEITVRF